MKAVELHRLTDGELAGKLDECKEEMFNIRWQSASHQNQNPKRARELKKDVARILTIINERNRKEAVS